MKKLLIAVITAFFALTTISAQAGSNTAPQRKSVREMKTNLKQHKARRVEIVQKRQEAIKAANERRQAQTQARIKAYNEAQAALAEQEAQEKAENGEVTENTAPEAIDEDANKSIEELQAEIEASLQELRENVGNLQEHVEEQVKNATEAISPETKSEE